ncbi:MAG: 7-cyano-7-deazaguanine synthase [Deltaproteobacteria bacterium]|nr:7-cyano-7-deazaguanine synthase [Deltaproteobacteria bacterium]
MTAPGVTLLGLAEDANDRDDGRPLEWAEAVSELARVRGPFAVVWRDAGGGVHLARDPLGHRSLYWGRDGHGRLVWGLRLHDVLAAGAARELDPVGLATYLAASYVPGEGTLVRGVRAVPPGVELVFERPTDVPKLRPFWHMPPSPAEYADDATLRARLRWSLEATIDRLLPQDDAVAATLSGGIDSSLVVALARRRRAVRALSITFGPEHRDELAWSGMVARHTGAEHEVVTVRPEDVMARFDATVGALSEPNGDPLTVPNTMLFEVARARGHDALFNGEGGDPSFGGPKNAPLLLSEVYDGDPEARWARERAYLKAHQKLWDELDDVLAPEVRRVIPEGAVEGLVTPWLEDSRWPSFLDRLMALNVAWKGPGHILPKVEHLGLRAGVRPRSPLFDRDVVALAFEIPSRLKRMGSIEKHLLKEAVADLLPREILDRPKSGMLVPVEAWFSGPLERWARERLLDGLAPRGLLSRAWLERLMDRKVGGLRPRRGVKIWLLMTLESWLRQVLRA